jgi:DNA-directed RNA polymerase subunit N (RpoN/RPB10)
MIGESIMNEYKAYKNLVKHKKRINRVFSELDAETSFRSCRLGVDRKAQAVAVASCSPTPPKASRRRSLKKGKNSTDDTSSVVRPDNTKCLESSKRKRKTSEVVSDAEIQAASSLAQLG